MRNTRPACVAFLILLYNWWTESLVAHAAEVNVTVDDTDPSISYQPAAFWRSSTVPCSFCLKPDPEIAHQKTFHDGTHIIPSIDDDDLPTSTVSKSPRPGVSAQSGDTDGDGSGDHDVDDDKGGETSNGNSGEGSQQSRRQSDQPQIFNPFATSKLDGDDPNFKDTPVFAQFNFTGSAIYLYCIIPDGQPLAPNAMPTSVNLSFVIDGQSVDRSFRHSGSSSASGFTPNVNVFAANGLTNDHHTLRVDVGPDSVFLFDYLIYTQVQHVVDGADTTSSSETTTSGATASESNSGSSDDQSNRRHNVATFAGAVGGSVGVLAIFALCLASSIYYRRWRSARRQRLERERDQESLHTDASEDSPPMHGPAPFVPRYFPGTVPTAPPPYIPSTPSSSSLNGSSPIMVQYTPLLSTRSRTRPASLSYADVPPPIMPLPLEDVLLSDDPPPLPPPSFGEAIASPLTIPHTIPPPPGIPFPTESTSEESNQRSVTPDPPHTNALSDQVERSPPSSTQVSSLLPQDILHNTSIAPNPRRTSMSESEPGVGR